MFETGHIKQKISVRFMLTKNDTTSLKGIALLMLLAHHLFFIQNGRFDDIALYKGIYLVNMTGQICKVCVALFVFLSGYGLMASYEKVNDIGLFDYFQKRFRKLFINYWLIWLLFVPIGIIFVGRTFESVYEENIVTKFLLDFFGLINLTGEYGYNPTWWFYSCIILLYALFPIIILGCRYRWCKYLMFWISISLVLLPFDITAITPIKYYLVAFLAGCYMQRFELKHLPHLQSDQTLSPRPLQSISLRAIQGRLKRIEKIVLLSGLFFLAVVRFKLPYALGFDTLITLLIVIAFKNISAPPAVSKFLGLCGKHSFNIFLFHTFLYYLYIPDIIYWSRNPIIIFLTLLMFCLPISYLINRIRGTLKFSIFPYKQKVI